MRSTQSARKKLHAHFIGIGGIGISALARWFLAKNWAVSGSDIAGSSVTQELEKEGVKVKIGHKKGGPACRQAGLPSRVDMVVFSEAIEPQNPELIEAKRRGIVPLSYPQALGCLTKAYKTLAVTGSHGKSTTTAMLALILIRAGFDPNVVIGTKLKEFGGKNFRSGKSKLLVLEADDYKAVFLNYSPAAIIATTLDREHLDVYKNLGNIKKAFLKFFAKIKNGGALVVNRDDKNLRSLHSPIARLAKRNSLRVLWYSLKSPEAKQIRNVLKIPGEHNVSNAIAAYTLATKILNIKKQDALKALAGYRGAWRRMEFRGYYSLPPTPYRLPVYDDYAHHPTEIKATLEAFKEKFPKRKIICVYQPHQGERLKALYPEFIHSFHDADTLILLPVYEVAGRDTRYKTWTSERLAASIKKRYPKKEVYYISNPERIKEFLRPHLPPPTYYLLPILIMMGAGDIANYTPLLLDKKRKRAV